MKFIPKTSYHRKKLDLLQDKYKKVYSGVVLDIGGRDRGGFNKPKDMVEKWIFADIVNDFKPDMVFDVCDMKDVESESVDVVNAMELFEHVKNPKKGIKECYRVLKKGGRMIISIPFMFPVHADPNDYQRWTSEKLISVLRGVEFEIESFEIVGRFFILLSDMFRDLLSRQNKIIRLMFFWVFIVFDFLFILDDKRFVLGNKILKRYHGGYFVVVKK